MCIRGLLSSQHMLIADKVAPDKVVFVVVLKACASLAALEQGKQLYSDIIKRGFQSDVIVGNTLVDMYAKCGVHRGCP
ncbi:hypothetical protein O6H91_Y378200 [Diphasiastrum complanatum]|nr:hypothetical protein O6H91_Y378200 [Diphasiastrum complanatum]